MMLSTAHRTGVRAERTGTPGPCRCEREGLAAMQDRSDVRLCTGLIRGYACAPCRRPCATKHLARAGATHTAAGPPQLTAKPQW